MPQKTIFTVYENTAAAYVMAYICVAPRCGLPVAAFGDDAYGMFSGRCANGHDSTTMAS